MSLRRAIALAEREAEWGVTASYMVQADCPLYRVDVAPGRERLGRLRELGHEVGLHVDLGSVADDEEAAARRVRAAAEKLGDVLGMPIESVSFHRPGRSLLHGPDRFAGLVNAYGKSMMTSYISDSQGRWRHGEPLPQIQAGSGRFLQILIHPIWWGESHRAPESRLRDFFERETAGLSPSEIEAFDAELGTAVGSVWPGRPK